MTDPTIVDVGQGEGSEKKVDSDKDITRQFLDRILGEMWTAKTLLRKHGDR